MMRRWLGRSVALLLVALACASPANAAVATNDSAATPLAAAGGQLRAFWVDAFGDGLYTQAQIDQLVADTKAANMNAIVAQVVRRGDCLCNRSSLPRTAIAGVAPAPFDPLQSLIDAAHAQGIQVHAWIITTGVWQGPSTPGDPAHAYNQHGPATTGAANWIDYRSDGAANLTNEYFIDPGHPDAAAYIVNMATSIARSYNVDGINLDRIRYPDGNLASLPSWGYNPIAIARFQAATGRTDRPASSDAAWTQWRRDQVTNIVRKIYLETYAIRPSIRISADTITYGSGPQSVGGWERTRTYAEVLQDWVGWLREGIIDINIVMNYKRDTDATQRSWYAQWADFTKDSQFQRASVVGSALYLNDIPSSIRQVRTAVAASTAGLPSAGWAGYSYRTPDAATDAGTRTGAAARAQLINALTKPSTDDPITPAVFATAVPAPTLPWKDQPTLGQLRGTATDVSGTPIAQAAITLYDANNNIVARRTTDAFGWFGVVDLVPGTYRAAIDSTRAAASTGLVTVAAGQVASVAPEPGAAPPCTSSVGPGIPPPASVPSGQSGFHASWYGQSGYPTLCAGERSTATVAYYNSGSRGWVSGRMGEVAYLGTWAPTPGQDQPTPLGGDGQLGSPNTSWPRYNRVALQPAAYVGPSQVAWFQFTIQAPTTPGTYRLYIRPLVEGAQWMEDYGVYWLVTVR